MTPEQERRLNEKLESLGLHLEDTIDLIRQARSYGDEDAIETAKAELKKALEECEAGPELNAQIRNLFAEAGIEL